MLTNHLLVLVGLLVPADAKAPSGKPGPKAPVSGSQTDSGPDPDELVRSFAERGVVVDYEDRYCAIEASVGIRDELLEYLLVLPYGAAHEALFVTAVEADVLNAALLSLGSSPGTNAQWAPKQPPPSEEDIRSGVSPYDVSLPKGDSFILYAGWREGEETYFYRVDDLVRDLARGRTMQRHRWVYLGSRMTERGPEREVVFAATMEGNLINVAFFTQGFTLVTPALEACVEQTIWLPNAWLLPPAKSPVLFVLSTERMEGPPPELVARLPDLDSVAIEDGPR